MNKTPSREIIFRGQTRKKGQKVNMAGDKLPGIWVYGGIFLGTGDHSIIYGEDHMELSGRGLGKHIVYTETVGQFTGQNADQNETDGRNDKQGKEHQNNTFC